MQDKRARLLVKESKAEPYNVPFMGPGDRLSVNRGIIFPYSPNITAQAQVEYSQYDMIHTNYQQNTFVKSRPPSIQLTAQFVHQTRDDLIYTAAVIHFLKVVTKMHFGDSDPDRGTPPPVLEFSAYGSMNFKRVPVLLGSYSMSYPDDIDYVETEVNGDVIQLPIVTIIAMDLIPQYNGTKVRNEFTLDNFARGKLYKDGFI